MEDAEASEHRSADLSLSLSLSRDVLLKKKKTVELNSPRHLG